MVLSMKPTNAKYEALSACNYSAAKTLFLESPPPKDQAQSIPYETVQSKFPKRRCLMLSRDLLASELFDIGFGPKAGALALFGEPWREKLPRGEAVKRWNLRAREEGNLHVTHSNHTNRLPNAQSNTWYNATVQTLKSIV